MAKLQVEVRPDAGVFHYSLFVDGVPVTVAAGHRGEVLCEGACGDGSSHALMYSFSGTEGSTLGILLKCRDRAICRIASVPIAERGQARTGRHLFDL